MALKALDTAAEADTATGGIDRHGTIFPIIKIVTEDRGRDSDRRQAFRVVPDSRSMIDEPYRWVEAISNRREYIENELATGSPTIGVEFLWWHPIADIRARPTKIFEIYDRIAMGCIGHPGDIERLRIMAIELASTEGFTRSAADVSLVAWRLILSALR